MKIAVITGASSGLGREFALKAFDNADIEQLWIIARNENSLNSISASLEGRDVRVIPMDLSKPESFESIRQMLKYENPDVRLLINCAGLGKLGKYEDIAPADIEAMCNVNVRALSLMTAAIIPYMSRGARIIMISSIASFAATPGMTVYSATKAYVSALSDGLRHELRERGINVLTVNPCPMDTAFLNTANIPGRSDKFAALPRCNPEKVAEQALLDSLKGKANLTPLLLFKFYRGLCRFTPKKILMKMTDLL